PISDHPLALLVRQLADPCMHDFPTSAAGPVVLEGSISAETIPLVTLGDIRRDPFEEIVLEVPALSRDRIAREQDPAYAHCRPKPAQHVFDRRPPASRQQYLRCRHVNDREDALSTLDVGNVDPDRDCAAFDRLAIDDTDPSPMLALCVVGSARIETPLNPHRR